MLHHWGWPVRSASKKGPVMAGEMHRLGALAAFAEDTVLVPSTHLVAQNHLSFRFQGI